MGWEIQARSFWGWRQQIGPYSFLNPDINRRTQEKKYLFETHDSIINKIILKGANSDGTCSHSTTGGIVTIACFVHGTDWVIVTMMDSQELFTPVNRQIVNIIFVISILLFIGIAIMLVFARLASQYLEACSLSPHISIFRYFVLGQCQLDYNS